MRRHFYSITARAGIPTWPQNDRTNGLRLHDLRHGCGTLLISLGVEPNLVQTLLRHSRLATTMDLSFTLAPKTCRDPAPHFRWAVLDSNQRPLRCERSALTG